MENAVKRCTSMTEVREEIDRLDRQIGALLVERFHYIREAGHIKPDRGVVRDSDRIEDVIAKVRSTVEQAGGNPELVEPVYRLLVETSINYEYTVFDARNDEPA